MVPSASGLFPLPHVPYPSGLQHNRSRRSVQRHSRANQTISIVNHCINSLNAMSTSLATPVLVSDTAPRTRGDSVPRSVQYRNKVNTVNSHSSDSDPLSVSSSLNREASNPPLPPLPSPSWSASPQRPNTARAQQQRALEYLYGRAQRYETRRRASALRDGHFNPNDASAGAGVAVNSTAWDSDDHFRYSDSIDTILGVSRATSSSSFQPVSSSTSAAVHITASKVSLPQAAGTADLMALLPPALQKTYSSQRSLLWDPTVDEPRDPPPKPILYATHSEYVALVKRMHSAGMLAFTVRPKAVNGIFGVPKDGGSSIRLIIDARPANALFKTPPKVQLPTPDVIAQMRVSPQQPFFTAKVDIDNFYHRLKCPAWLQPYFALPPVCVSELGMPDVTRQFGASAMIHPMCTTLPMGWSHSVYVAQSAHEWLLDSELFGVLSAGDRIGAFASGFADYHLTGRRIMHAVYIDDLSMFGTDRSALAAAQRAYQRVAESRGLAVKSSKVVLPSADAVDVLGLEIDGTEHTIGLSVPKLEALCADTAALLAAHESSSGALITGLQLAHLVGRWTWAILANRPALSVFSAVYRFIETADRRRFTLWQSAAAELAVIMGLAPLLLTHLAAPDYPTILATDASETGRGVVAFTPPRPDMTLAIPEVVQPRSVPAFEMQSNAGASQQSSPQQRRQSLSLSNLPDATGNDDNTVSVDSVHWTTIVSDRWRRPEHINVLELRALDTAVRWVLTRPFSVGTRVSMLSDSQVVIGAVRKGRSSSRPLLRRLRCLGAAVLGGGLQLDVQWIPSEFNPADVASRQ
jgi:hypothetical protein